MSKKPDIPISEKFAILTALRDYLEKNGKLWKTGKKPPPLKKTIKIYD